MVQSATSGTVRLLLAVGICLLQAASSYGTIASPKHHVAVKILLDPQANEGTSSSRLRHKRLTETPCDQLCEPIPKDTLSRWPQNLGAFRPWQKSTTTACYSPRVTDALRQARQQPIPGMPGITVGMAIQELRRRGCPVVAKGGVVRDAFLNTPPKDVDLACLCPPDRIKAICIGGMNGNGATCRDPGKNNVVIIGDSAKVHENNNTDDAVHETMDVLGNPNFFAGSDAELEFTANSLAYDFENDAVLDLANGNGIADVCNHEIRIPAQPELWDAWYANNSYKIFRFWKLRTKGFYSFDQQTQDFVVGKVKSDFNTKNVREINMFRKHYCYYGLGGRYNWETGTCSSCGSDVESASKRWNRVLAEDFGSLWDTELSNLTSLLIGDCQKDVKITDLCDNEQWLYHDGMCYLHEHSVGDVWFFSGKQVCQERGADVVSLHSAEQESTVRTVAEGRTVWLNLIFTCCANPKMPQSFSWLDKRPLDYSNWAPDTGLSNFEQTRTNVNGTCVSMRAGGGWQSELCSNSRAVVCAKAAKKRAVYVPVKPTTASTSTTTTPTPTTTPVAPPTCPTGWYLYRRNCYLLVRKSELWADAMMGCQRMNSGLANFSDADELRFVFNVRNNNEYTWVAARATDDLSPNNKSAWKWYDTVSATVGNPVLESLWHSTHPFSTDSNDRCAVIDNTSSCLLQTGCSYSAASYVCKKPA